MGKIVTIGRKDYLIVEEYEDGRLLIEPVIKVDDLRSELQEYSVKELTDAATIKAIEEEQQKKFDGIIIGEDCDFFDQRD